MTFDPLAYLWGRQASSRHHKSRNKDRRVRRAMFLEGLESREMMAVDAVNDFGITTEDAISGTLSNPAGATTLLQNDTASPGMPMVVYFDSTSAKGAAVNVNGLGMFTYNPTVSLALQGLQEGETTEDTFSYIISDKTMVNSGFLIRSFQPANNPGNLAAADTFLAGNPTPTFSGSHPVVNFFHLDGGNQHFVGAGTASSLDDETPVPGLTAGDVDNYVVEATADLVIPVAGRYTFSVNSDDGFGLQITGATLVSVHGQDDGTSTTGLDGRLRYSAGRGTQDTYGVFEFATPGVYSLRLVNWEGGGGSSVEMFAAAGDFGAAINATATPGTQGFAAARLAGANWQLVGDTSNGALRVYNPNSVLDIATVTYTVTGINDAPVAGPDFYEAEEDSVLSVPAVIETVGMNVAVYRGTNSSTASFEAIRGTQSPSDTGTVQLADFLAGPNFSTNNPVPGGGGDNYAVLVSGIMRVSATGTYTFGTHADDAARIRIDLNQDGIIAIDGSEDVAGAEPCCVNHFGTPRLLQAGDYQFEAFYTEGGGGDHGEFFYAPGSKVGFDADFRLLGDSSQGITTFSSIVRPGLVGNDTDLEVALGVQQLAVTQLNGNPVLSGFSTLGAAVTLNANGSFTYNPMVPGSFVFGLARGQTAVDTFTYTVSDNDPTLPKSATQTVTIQVTGTDNPPVAVNDNHTVNENTVLVANDVDNPPRDNEGDSTPVNTNDDGVLVNDLERDSNNVYEVLSARLIGDPGMDVAVYNQQGAEPAYGTLVVADAVRNTVGRNPNFTGTVALADFIGNGGSPNFPGGVSFPGTVGDNYAVYLTGILRVDVGGMYTFGVNSDDNSRIRIETPNGDIVVAQHNGCCNNQFGAPISLPAGDYPFEAMYTEGGGGDYGEFFYAPGSKTAFDADFRLIGDGSQGIRSFRTQELPLSGTVGTLDGGSTTFSTVLGASVTLLDDGTFTYDPTTSPTLQALSTGESLVDTFQYTASDNQAPLGLNVKLYQPAAVGDLAGADAFLANPIRPNEKFNGTERTINYVNTGAVGQFTGAGTASPLDDERNPPTILPGSDANDYIMEAMGQIYIPAAGDYTFVVNSDDGFGLAFSGGPGVVSLASVAGDNDGTSTLGVGGRMTRSTGRGAVDTLGVFNFTQAGTYDLRLVYWEGAGGSAVEFYAAPGAFNEFAQTNTWRLVGDTDNGGLEVYDSQTTNKSSATVSITVQGENGAPVANPDSYATNEDSLLNVPAQIDVPGMNVAVYRGTGAAWSTFEPIRSTTSPSHTGIVQTADFLGGPNFGFNNPVPGGAGDNYAVLVSGVLRIDVAGTYTFGTHTDDASRIRIDLNNDGIVATDGSEDVAIQDGCCNNAFGAPITLAAGYRKFEAIYTEGGGGDHGEFFYSPGTKSAFDGDFRILGDTSAGITTLSNIILPGLLGNDTNEEPSQILSVTQLNGAPSLTGVSSLGALVTLNPDGSFTYDPNVAGSAVQALSAGQVAVDTFTYTVSDDDALNPLSATQTVSITVIGKNDLPLSIDDNFGTDEDTVVTSAPSLLANDIEVDDNDVTEILSVTYLVSGINVAVYNQAAGESINGTLGNADAVRNSGRVPNHTGMVQQADFIGNGGSSHFSVNNTFPGTGGDNYAVYLTGTLRVDVGGTYTFGVNSDDSSRIRIDTGSGFVTVAELNGCCADSIGTPISLPVGDYPFEAMYTEGGGGDYGEFFYAPGSHGGFNSNFRLLGDGSQGIRTLASVNAPLGGTVGVLDAGAASFVTLLGASVTVRDDGTYSYDPTTSATLQALNPNESAIDSFNYTATDHSPAPGLRVKVYQPAAVGDLNGADAFLAGTRTNERFDGTRRAINFYHTDSAGRFTGVGSASPFDDETTTPGLGGGNQDNYVTEVTGQIFIPAAGNYTFVVNSDDGFGLQFLGDPGTVTLSSVAGDNDGTSTLGVDGRMRRSTGRGAVDSLGVFNFSQSGFYDLNLVNWEGSGGSALEFYAAAGSFASFASTNTWALVGDTFNGGLEVFDPNASNLTSAQVTITVEGRNDNPVAVDDSALGLPAYVTDENSSLNVPTLLTPGMNVAVYQNGSIGADIETADAYRANNPPTASGTVQLADFNDNNDGAGGQFGVNQEPFGLNPTGGDNNYAVFVSGTFHVVTGGLYTFGTFSDDNSRIRIDLNQDGTIATDGSENVATQTGCCGNVFGTPVNLAPGYYRFEAGYSEGGGGSYGEFFYAAGSHTSFNSNFRLLGDAAGGIASYREISGLLLNDFDIDNGDSISVDTATIVSTNGATIIPQADGSFSYDPSTSLTIQLLLDGQILNDTFEYTLLDSFGGSSTATVTVVVTGISDPVDDTYTVNEDNPGDGIDLNQAAPGVLANDALSLPLNPVLEVLTAQGVPLSGTVDTLNDGSAIVATAAGGEVVIQDNGAFTYDQLGIFDYLGVGEQATDNFVYTLANHIPANLNWDFGNADLQGWTVLNGAVFFRPDEGGGVTPANGGGGFAHDPAHTTLLIQSPEFRFSGQTVDGTNALRVEFAGGAGDQENVGQIFNNPAQVLAYNGGNTNSLGQKGLAFLNSTTGQYVTTIFENDNGGTNIRSFTPADLIARGLVPGQSYRLHYFENDDGGWGWGQLNFVQFGGSSLVESASTEVTLNIIGQNDAPVVSTGGPYVIDAGTNLVLNASGTSDVDLSDTLTYRWDLNNDGTDDIVTNNSVFTYTWLQLQVLGSFTPGVYPLRLTVGDGHVDVVANTTFEITPSFVFNPIEDGVEDGYTLVLNNAQDTIEIRDTATFTLITSTPRAGVDKVIFNGTNDRDTLTVDFRNTNPIPVDGVVFHGGNPTTNPGDSLVLTKGTALVDDATTISYVFVTEHDGSVDIDGRVITYTGLEPISDNLDAVTRNFDFTSAADESIVVRNSVVAGFDLFMDSSAGEFVNFVNPTGAMNITLSGGGVDTIDVQTANVAGNFSITGSGNNDVVNLTGTLALGGASATASIAAVQAVNFTGGLLQAANVSLDAGVLTTTTSATDVVATSLIATAATGINLDTTVIDATLSNTGAGNIAIDNNGALNLLGLSVANGTAAITATGALTDGPTAVSSVSGNANFSAPSITLGETAGDSVNFGSLTFVSAGDVVISEDSGTDLVGTNTAGSLDLDSTGAISDAGATSVSITGLADFNGTSISLGGGIFNAGTLMFNSAGAVTISEDSALDLVGTNTASSATLSALGNISDAGATSVDVMGLLSLNGEAISLGSGIFNAGTLTFVATSTVNITEDSTLNLVGANSATGAVTLTTVDTLAGTENIVLVAGVTLAGSSITLNAGDNATINGDLTATTTVAINVDFNSADPLLGGILTIGAGVTIAATSANFGGAGQGDTFNFAPQTSTPITVSGLAPTVFPGDTLNLNTTGALNTTLGILGGQGSGIFSFDNLTSVQYSSIEYVITTVPYDITLDATATGVESILLQRSDDAAIGTNFEVYNDATSELLYSGAIAGVLSFQFIGSANDNRVIIDDVNGLVDLVGTVPGVADNGNVGGIAEIYLQGNGGNDQLNFENRANNTNQTYGLGTGSGAGTGAGEVLTVTGGLSLSVYFDGLTGVLSNDASPGDTGTLTIIGDAAANSIFLESSATGTEVRTTGYVPLTFTPRAFSAVNVNAGDNDDSLTLISLNAGETGLALTLNGEGGDDTIAVESAPAGSTLALQGGAGNDTYLLGGSANTLDNILIPITINDASGDDVLVLNDSASLSDKNVTVTEATIDGVNAAPGIDVNYGGIETLTAFTSGGNDTIRVNFGVAPSDVATATINGSGGNDQFYLDGAATASLDFLYLQGGGGNDTFGAAPTGGIGSAAPADAIIPVAGNVQIVISGESSTSISGPNPTGDNDQLNLNLSTFVTAEVVDTVTGQVISIGTMPAHTPLYFNGIEDLNLFDGDVLTNTIIGDLYLRSTDDGTADNILFYRGYTSASDVLVRMNNRMVSNTPFRPTTRVVAYGRGGGDSIQLNYTAGTIAAEFHGEDGNDKLLGSFQNDLLVGGAHNDHLIGMDGNDILWGDQQALTWAGRSGDNSPGSTDGDDILEGTAGDDLIFGGGGNDLLNGMSGSDYLHGGFGNDNLVGGDGNDFLRAGDGNDTLVGDAGDDIAIAGAGDDFIYGSAGRDFHLAGADSDRVYDLNDNGEDISVTEALTYDADLANPAYNPNDPLTFFGPNDVALLALMTSWTNPVDSFATRAAAASAILLPLATNDGAIDYMYGNTLAQDYSIVVTGAVYANRTGDAVDAM